jgi:hypothetical protein
MKGLRLSAIVSLEEFGDVDLSHLQHHLHDAIGLLLIRNAEHFGQNAGYDLPGEAELVLRPSAGALFAAIGRKLFAVVIDFVLIAAIER